MASIKTASRKGVHSHSPSTDDTIKKIIQKGSASIVKNDETNTILLAAHKRTLNSIYTQAETTIGSQFLRDSHLSHKESPERVLPKRSDTFHKILAAQIPKKMTNLTQPKIFKQHSASHARLTGNYKELIISKDQEIEKIKSFNVSLTDKVKNLKAVKGQKDSIIDTIVLKEQQILSMQQYLQQILDEIKYLKQLKQKAIPNETIVTAFPNCMQNSNRIDSSSSSRPQYTKNKFIFNGVSPLKSNIIMQISPKAFSSLVSENAMVQSKSINTTPRDQLITGITEKKSLTKENPMSNDCANPQTNLYNRLSTGNENLEASAIVDESVNLHPKKISVSLKLSTVVNYEDSNGIVPKLKTISGIKTEENNQGNHIIQGSQNKLQESMADFLTRLDTFFKKYSEANKKLLAQNKEIYSKLRAKTKSKSVPSIFVVEKKV